MTTKQKDTDILLPRSFRLTEKAIEALDRGAERFRMNRTQWLEFLATSAVADREVKISTESAEIVITSKHKQ